MDVITFQNNHMLIVNKNVRNNNKIKLNFNILIKECLISNKIK